MSTGHVLQAVVTRSSGIQLVPRPVKTSHSKVLRARIVVAGDRTLNPGIVNE